MNDKFTIMFVCTGNTCRSPMAEGAMKVLLEKKVSEETYEVISSGTSAAYNFPATMYATEAAKIWDADISDHQSQILTTELIDRADLIFAMTKGHYAEILRLNKGVADKTYLFKNFPEHGSNGEGLSDPIGQELSVYNETFLEVGEHLGEYLEEIVKRIKEH